MNSHDELADMGKVGFKKQITKLHKEGKKAAKGKKDNGSNF